MNLQEFINKYDGKGLDYDKKYGDQCLDLFHYYELEVLGIALNELLRAATAYLAYCKGKDHFDKIKYESGLIPEPGDIMFWNTGAGRYGHVAIFVEGSDSEFISFDQNWPVGSNSHKQEHDYDNVAGWLRYNQLTKDDMEQIEQLRKDVDTLLNENHLRKEEIIKLQERKAGKKKQKKQREKMESWVKERFKRK